MYDPVDDRGVPQSKGIPMAVRITAAIGVVLIFAIGAFVIKISDYGHQWPSTQSLRIPL
ncbi:MAG: hypothetical protein M3Y21_03880 [Candidatus Eremiobacteraeota bacterium]|nr:hypothetical protein [Candidatus Eremiobacteraeota bacterium]